MTEAAERNDLTMAMSLAVGAIVLGSFLPWAHGVLVDANGTDGDGNLTLLLGGVAGALIARWRLERGVHRSLLTASLGLCAAATAVLLYEIVNVAQMAAQPQEGLFLATAGAIAATALSVMLLQRTRVAAAPL